MAGPEGSGGQAGSASGPPGPSVELVRKVDELAKIFSGP